MLPPACSVAHRRVDGGIFQATASAIPATTRLRPQSMVRERDRDAAASGSPWRGPTTSCARATRSGTSRRRIFAIPGVAEGLGTQSPIANPHWIFPSKLRLRIALPSRDTGSAPSPAHPAAAGVSSRPPSNRGPIENLHGDFRLHLRATQGLRRINGSLGESPLATEDHAYSNSPLIAPEGARATRLSGGCRASITAPSSKSVLGYLVHVYGDFVIDS